MTRRTVTLLTPHALDQVRTRLSAAIDHPLNLTGGRPVRGRVGPYTAWLYQRRPINNAFQTVFSLVLEPQDERQGDGVILHGVSDIGAFGRVLLGLMTLMLVGVAITARHELGAASAIPWLIAGAGAFGVGVIYAVGRAMAAGEHDFLVRFLIQTLDARVIQTPRDD